MENIRKLRKDPDAYAWMLDNIAPLVVGSGKFKEESKKCLPTKWMTPSSEAFAVLCLENYYDNIQDIASCKASVRKPLWTNKGLGAKRNQGWSREGLEKFKANCEAVVKNRAMESMRKVDTDYWKAKQMELDRGEERKRKREETRDNREKGWQVAPVDEWTEDEEEDTNLQQEGDRSPNADSGADDEDDKLH
jgi:hypothetical protein